jgi:hypothetical protein
MHVTLASLAETKGSGVVFSGEVNPLDKRPVANDSRPLRDHESNR